jgi:hypothetical protein
MRVNLLTHTTDRSESNTGAIPLLLTIRPACGLPGDYDWQTDSKALLRLLRLQTDLPEYKLERFEEGLHSRVGARLTNVELNDTVLTKIGYFID